MSRSFSNPGLYLHRGNSLEGQARLLAEILTAAPEAPLRAEEVIVQSLGMARWITLRLAEELGVCAQVKFPFPRKFFDGLAENCLSGGREPADRASWQEGAMTWALLEELLALEGGLSPESALAEVRGYLHPPGREAGPAEVTLRAYQLAARIARLFDQYLLYRPDLIRAWNANTSAPLTDPAEPWQRALWRRLKRRSLAGGDPVERHDHLLQALGAARLGGLPRRAFFFGITALPPFYLKLLPLLARHIPVHVFLPQPTAEFWSDIVSEREERRRARRGGGDEVAYLQRGHPLLASWGTQGKEFQQLIDALPLDDGQGTEEFHDPLDLGVATPSLLRTLQSDILHLRARGEAGLDAENAMARENLFAPEPEPRLVIEPGDRSLSVHACGGPLREVEVLRDQLLAAFQELPGLEPRDIVVMAPDIALYTPYIETVFGAGRSSAGETVPAERIPYNIADRTATEANQIARVILRLFAMTRPGERFTATDMLDLVEMPALRRGQGLDEPALERIRAWVRNLPVHWGRDARQRADLDLPGEPGQTWREGLDRLLLGYGTGRHGELLGDLAPYADLGSDDWMVLGRFGGLVKLIFAQLDVLSREATLPEWSERLLNLLSALFPALPPESEIDLRQIREILTEIAPAASEGVQDRPLPTRVIEEHLTQLLQLERHAYGFIAGGVTFCALKPMRSIPFRVVCLLGMNDRAFPRQDVRTGFDLMAGRNRRAGDRSRREEDRYLFLEALLAARDRLIISYSSLLPQETQRAEPCPLVVELLEHLEEACARPEGGPVRPRLTVEHPLHAFDPRYFERRADNPLFSFSRANLTAALRKQLGATGGTAAPFLRRPLEADPEMVEAAEEGGRITLDELIRLLRNPCRYFLEKRLELALEERQGVVEDSERFILNGLDVYKLRARLLDAGEDLLDPAKLDHLFRLARAEGLLPHGQPGRLAFSNACAEAKMLLRIQEGMRLTPLAGPVIGSFPVGLLQVDARLDNVYAERMVIAPPSSIKAEREIEFWLRHLALGQLGPRPDPSLLIGMQKAKSGPQEIYGYELPVESAAAGLPHLEHILQLREEALAAPLHFLPQPALDFVASLEKNPNDLYKAKNAARNALTGGYSPDKGTAPDEKNAWRELCFPSGFPLDGQFEQLAEEIWTPYLALRRQVDSQRLIVAA